jgi:hypothetical protein
LVFGCSKDDSLEDQLELDLAGIWEMSGLGSFTIMSQVNGSLHSLTTVTIDHDDMICTLANLKQDFGEWENQVVTANKIEHALSGDQVDFFGFDDQRDLKRIDFSCDFSSFPIAEVTIIVSLRNSFGSNWCDRPFNFMARKK